MNLEMCTPPPVIMMDHMPLAALADVQRLALSKGARWGQDKRTIMVGVHGEADPDTLQLVQSIVCGAEGWNSACGLQFSFWHPRDTADLRVSFQGGNGSWSFLGTEAIFRCPPENPTMNFGWLNRYTPYREARRVVLHEFGHALGFIHEHQSPYLHIPWDLDRVYEHYRRTNGWTKDMVDINVLSRYTPDEVVQVEGDAQSIMCYLIDPSLLSDKSAVIGGNTELSPLDRQRAAEWYGEPPQRWRSTMITPVMGGDGQ